MPFPNKPGEPDWRKIGWEHFENLDVNKVIWERWAPPMRNRYLSLRYLEELGRKEFSYDVDHLGSMTDEELVRLDDEIKKMSYTLANKQADEMEKERVDVENPAPGRIEGNVHYHEPDNTKWKYDVNLKRLVYRKTGELVPPKVQKVLKEEWFQKALKKALKILGE